MAKSRNRLARTERRKRRLDSITQCLAAHPDIFQRCNRDGSPNIKGDYWQLRVGTKEAGKVLADHINADPVSWPR